MSSIVEWIIESVFLIDSIAAKGNHMKIFLYRNLDNPSKKDYNIP